jgi:hypothetical protein
LPMTLEDRLSRLDGETWSHPGTVRVDQSGELI